MTSAAGPDIYLLTYTRDISKFDNHFKIVFLSAVVAGLGDVKLQYNMPLSLLTSTSSPRNTGRAKCTVAFFAILYDPM